MKNTDYKGLVLIYGAGLGSFIWDEMVPKLNLPSLAVGFSNRDKADDANAKLSFDDYAGSIIEQIKKWNVEKFVIVTHSIGGCVGLKVAEYLKAV